ncbi:MAG: neutral/alkaline non-lysosomal ceramidase N-terminal domain-containing protein [Phycisphaerae bacterium]|nr:neutral/alkaline non-lysosomal ceramidase N-terminal domain-containing protein [Phycisphaerae bacterium]
MNGLSLHIWRPGIVAAGLVLAASLTSVAGAGDAPVAWKAGVARVVITPEQNMWMAGYAARNKPSEGKVHDLFAKALALEDAEGTRLVLVTMDLIGIPREFRDRMIKEVGERYKLAPSGLLLNVSHTHSGPELRDWRGTQAWDLPPEQIELGKQYSDVLFGKVVDLVGRALRDLAPAQLSYTHGRAGLGMNRRSRTADGYAISPNADGPVDHDVPILQVSGADGKVRALVFGYACHNTTLSDYEFCGDYAGFAQQYVEETHPGTVAMFVEGCGGDQNPTPRRTMEWARQHGRTLANAVEAALVAKPRPVRGPLRVALGEATLELEPPASVEELKQQTQSQDKYQRRYAEEMLREIEGPGRRSNTYPYLVQVVQFGRDLTMIALAGEVLVDYSLRLKKELPGEPVWVAGYSNDVFGYVPSARVLQEGGYEARGAVLYYGTTMTPFRPSVEQLIVDKVHELVSQVRGEK